MTSSADTKAKGETPIERKKASEFSPDILNLFDLYVHGDIDRRGFIDRATKYTVGGLSVLVVESSTLSRIGLVRRLARIRGSVEGQ